MRWVIGPAAVLLLLALVPVPAASQGAGEFSSTFQIDSVHMPAAPLVPDGAPKAVRVYWNYTFNNPAAAATSVVPGASTTLHWTPNPKCDDAYVHILGSFAEPIGFHPPGPYSTQTQYSGVSNFSIEASLDAAGEIPVTCTFTGYVDAVNSQVPQTARSSNNGQAQVQYVGRIAVVVPATTAQGAPRSQIQYDVVVTNLGNARSNINFDVEDAHSGDGWSPIAPSQFIVESKQQGAATNEKTVAFLVATPYHNGWNNKETTFNLKVHPSSTRSDLQGNETVVSVLARVRGCYPSNCTSAPAPGPAFALVLLAVAATVRRHR
jgi:MYXO-CTERM domain-containing protein